MTVAAPIVLLNMPMTAVERPSLALGLLKSLLARDGQQITLMYPNMWFLDFIGIEDYALLETCLPEEAMVDWIFAGVAFPDFAPDQDAFLVQYFERNPFYGGTKSDLGHRFRQLRARMGDFIEWVVEKVLALSPSVVGCTSTFQQHVASLAVLRRIRERAPAVVTLMGGANCETLMGRTTHSNFKWVDYIVSGEADTLIGPLCRDILRYGREVPAAALGYGVFGPHHRKTGYPATMTGDKVPRAVTDDIRELPLPDYTDYFLELSQSIYARRIYPGIPMEFSRGCWWGERSHCTFCGLNGSSMSYRAKPAENAARDMIEMAGRYGSNRIEAVDNILAIDYIDQALPALANLPDKLSVFFEVKANLKRHEVEKLAASGVRWIQPGIESLDSKLLRMMGKGVTAAHNVQLLKWCRQYGVRVSWSVLWGFPGEDDQWYGDMAKWIPLLHHLQPGHTSRLRYQRYSPYFNTPDKYGLSLKAYAPYDYVYPLDDMAMFNQVYYFEDRNDIAGHVAGRHPARRPGLHALATALSEWMNAWSGTTLPMLSMSSEGDELIVHDTRANAAASRQKIGGLAREILLAADTGAVEGATRVKLIEQGNDPGLVDETIADLCVKNLLVRLDGRLVGLALWHPHVPMLAPSAFPGGYMARDLSN